MHRIRILVAALAVFAVLGAAPAFAQTESGDGPAVVIEDDSGAIEEDAWTFRYLVPSLLVVTGIVVLGVVVGYGVRVRGRYRVVE